MPLFLEWSKVTVAVETAQQWRGKALIFKAAATKDLEKRVEGKEEKNKRGQSVK